MLLAHDLRWVADNPAGQHQSLDGALDVGRAHLECCCAGHQARAAEESRPWPSASRISVQCCASALSGWSKSIPVPGDAVGCLEANTGDVVGEKAVGLIVDDGGRLVAILLDDASGQGTPDAVAVQGGIDLSFFWSIGPMVTNALHALLADARNLEQSLRGLFDDCEGVEAEGVHHALGELLAETGHGTGSQVAGLECGLGSSTSTLLTLDCLPGVAWLTQRPVMTKC